MADNIFIAQTSSEIGCYNSGSNKTILQIKAPATMQVKVLGFGIFFDGTSVNAEPVQVMIAKQLSAGTFTSSVTPVKLKNYPETIQTTATEDQIAPPSDGDIIESFNVHPQAGYEIRYPDEECPVLGFSERLGVVVNASSDVNCRVKLICEE